MNDEAIAILDEKIEEQTKHVEHWRQPVEPLLLETVRAIDTLFMEEHFYPAKSPERMPASQYSMSTWGVNKALSLTLPRALSGGPFRLFTSTFTTGEQANELLFQCGVLQRAETLRDWLREGLLTARIDRLPENTATGIDTVLVLKSNHPSMFSEVVSRSHRRWVSDLTVAHDGAWEGEMQERHAALQPELEASVRLLGDWGISYTTMPEIDNHFLECGQLYLRRMWSQDLLGTDDKIGGEPFGHYLGLLAALAGRGEKHLCFTSILKRRHPHLNLKNLLTTFSPCDEFVVGLAAHMDAETLQIKKLLSCLTLGPANLEVHTAVPEPAWTPIVRSSHDHYILPLYGLEINPFLFLLTELQARYPAEWDRAANNREKRWHLDLAHIFGDAKWVTSDRNTKLRDGGRTITDLDYVAFDQEANELAIFQLKWQHPVGMGGRARRSAGKNLLSQGNDWIEKVLAWLERYGVAELSQRIGISFHTDVKVELFVIGRYNAHFTGFSDGDQRATWADWNHLMRARLENPRASVCELAQLLRNEVQTISASFEGESYIVPLGNVAIILNPATEPA